MTTSSQTAARIFSFESCKLVPYNDASGNATVGVGHLLHLGPLNGTEKPITIQQALSLFAADLVHVSERYINEFVRVPLTQNKFDALSSFTFNLGAGTLQHVISETGLNQGGYVEVPLKILEYNKARVNGELVVLDGLTRRRQFEVGLWNSDQPGA